MRKLLLISISIFLLLLSSFLSQRLKAGTYNFYFYDNEDGKNKKESQELKEKNMEEISSQPSPEQTIISPSAPSSPPSKSYFLTSPDHYFSVGLNSEFYFPSKVYFPNGTSAEAEKLVSPTIFFRTKFLPLITLEGAFPLSSYHDKFELYRGGLLVELGLWKTLSLHLGGGLLYNVYYKELFPLDFDTKYNHAFAGYLGAGVKVRLFNHFDVSATVNTIPNYGNLIGRDILTTAGLAYVF